MMSLPGDKIKSKETEPPRLQIEVIKPGRIDYKQRAAIAVQLFIEANPSDGPDFRPDDYAREIAEIAIVAYLGGDQ